MLVQLHKDNFVATNREELVYEVYNGYFDDNFSSTVFTSNNFLVEGTTNDLTDLTTAVEANISGTDVKSAIIFGYFRAKKTGTYSFYTRSRDASYLRINNVNVVFNAGTHDAETVYGVFNMDAGSYYTLVIYYGNSGTGQAEFSAGYYDPADGLVIPELPLSGNTTTLTGVGLKYPGEYNVTISNQGPSSREKWFCFDKTMYGSNRMESKGGIYNRTIGSFGTYYSNSGDATTDIIDDPAPYRGEWLQLELPTAIRIKHFKISRRTDTNNGLIDLFTFLGSNDPSTGWYKLYERTTPSSTYWSSNIHEVKSFDVASNENAYKYYRIAVFRTQGGSAFHMGELLLYTEPPPEDINSYIQDANGLTTYYDRNPRTQAVLTTSDFPLLYEDNSLQGKFKVSPLAVYINLANFSLSKHNILYLASDDLFNNFNGTYKNYIQLHEKPVYNDTERKRFTQFSDDMSFECELNGRIQLTFRRGTAEPVSWRYAMVILDVERISN